MKKETINTFTGGLNKDLNPLVTPNDILTDALNAQMLTFNGDELSLQTDAGNTKIKVGNDFVKLSEGFYPLGIKEYGGVLYIVSGRSIENNLKALTENTDYFKYDTVRFKNNYYYCNEDTSITVIPESLDSKWTSLGSDINSARKQFDFVEFGSYPAPEFSDDQLLYGIGNNITPNKLYRTYIINNNFFKTGRKIQFSTGTGNNISNLTTNSNSRIYIAKLFHQLDNGILDLTDDIWESFNKHKINTGDPATHWLTSDMFYYYCPSRFKGKLQLQVILDEPEFFRLKNNPVLGEPRVSDDPDEESSNTLKFDLEWSNSTNIKISGFTIKLSSGETRYPDIEVPNIEVAENLLAYTGWSEIWDVPYQENFDTLRSVDYTIIPEFSYQGEVLDTGLPFEFTNKYKISGTILLDQKYQDIYFDLIDGECVSNGYKEYNKAVLRNREGLVDTSLESSAVQYIFAKENSQTTGSLVMATYKIGEGNRPVILEVDSDLKKEMDTKHPGLFKHLISMFTNTEVSLKDGLCQNLTIKLKFNLELPFESPTKLAQGFSIIATQQNISTEALPIFIGEGRTVELDVNSAEDVKLSMRFEPYEWSDNITLLKDSFSHNKVYNIGIVTKLRTQSVFQNNSIGGSYYYSLGNQNYELYDSIFTERSFKIVKGPGVTRELNALYRAETYIFGIEVSPLVSWNDVKNVGGTMLIPFEVIGNALQTNYINITSPEKYVEIGNNLGSVIFTKNNNLTITLAGINIS